MADLLAELLVLRIEAAFRVDGRLLYKNKLMAGKRGGENEGSKRMVVKKSNWKGRKKKKKAKTVGGRDEKICIYLGPGYEVMRD